MVNDLNRSAARVLDVLEHLADAADGVSLTQAALELGLPKSSTLMLLRTLVARGYVARDAADRYRMSEAFHARGFGRGGHRVARLLALAEPVMRALCARVGETVILGVLEGTGVRLLAQSVAAQAIRYDADLSTPSPAFCTAMGRVLLAAQPPGRREEILAASRRDRLTPATVTALPALRAIIRAAAREGVVVVEEEFAPGGTGVAAPVLGPGGDVVAALDVGCVTARFHGKRELVLGALRESAAHLSALLAEERDGASVRHGTQPGGIG